MPYGIYNNQEPIVNNIFENKSEFSAEEFNELLTLMRNKGAYSTVRNGEDSFELLVRNNIEDLIDNVTEVDNVPICLIQSERFRDSCINRGRFDLAVKCVLPPDFFENEELTSAYQAELGLDENEFTQSKEWLQNYYQRNVDAPNIVLGTSLKNGIFNLDKEHYERFINDVHIQAELAKLNDAELSLLSGVLDKYDYKDFDATLMVGNIVSNIKDYSDLVSAFEKEDFSDDELRTLVGVLQLPNNQYQINSVDDLKNYSSIKQRYFIDNFESSDLSTNKDNLAKMLFNIDLDEAKFIDDRYCHDKNSHSTLKILKDSELPEEDYNYLAIINNILSCKNNDELASFYGQLTSSDIYESEVPLDSYLKSEYTKLYSNSLYRIDEHQEDIVGYATYQGKNIQISMPSDGFNIFMHVVGTCSSALYENYAEDWLEQPYLQDHLVSCSYVNDKRMKKRTGGGITIGFDSLEGGAILAMSDTDIDSLGYDSIKYNGSRLVQESGKLARYQVPSEILDSKSPGYNEIVVERRDNDKENREYFKRKPDYIIMMAESGDINNFRQLDDLYDNQMSFVAEEDKEAIGKINNPRELKAFLKKYINQIRQQAENQGIGLNELGNNYVREILKAKNFEDHLKAASEFDVPLVVINQAYYEQRNKAQ